MPSMVMTRKSLPAGIAASREGNKFASEGQGNERT